MVILNGLQIYPHKFGERNLRMSKEIFVKLHRKNVRMCESNTSRYFVLNKYQLMQVRTLVQSYFTT